MKLILKSRRGLVAKKITVIGGASGKPFTQTVWIKPGKEFEKKAKKRLEKRQEDMRKRRRRIKKYGGPLENVTVHSDEGGGGIH